MTQDVFLVLVEALRRGSVAEPERVGGFVLGICRNLIRERAKARGRREELWAQFGHALAEVCAEPPACDPYEVSHLEDCLTQLSSRARDVVRLTYVDGQSNADIAEKLTLSEANVRVLRHRTLKTLRECLSKPMPWEIMS
jgi:RNA polymerase sigma factor (sigma-70 family)